MLSRLGMTNFKAFAQTDLPLAPYTLLSGMNSTGKSTILQALALLRQSKESLLDGDGGGLLLNGDLVELGNGQDVLNAEFISETSTSERQITISLDCDGRSMSWSVVYEQESDLLRLAANPQSYATLPEVLSGNGFQYLRADRISPAVTYPRSHEVAIRQTFLGARGEHTANYLRHFQDDPVPEALHHPNANSPRLLNEVDSWMEDICPGVNIQVQALRYTDLVRLTYSFGTAGLSSSGPYRPTNVGFGLTYVLPVVVACLTAKPGVLLLLENPEAHLHPRGQTAMARLTCAAAAAGAQVIVETHSDHVLNGVRLSTKNGVVPAENVMLHFFLRSVSPGAVEVATLELGADGMISQWPDGFFDEWERSLDQLLN